MVRSAWALALAGAVLLGGAPRWAQAQAQVPGVNRTNYTVMAGDDLEIYVWGEERLQRVLRVLPDGTVAFPLAGQLKVQGLLLPEVERLIGDKLKSQYKGDVPNVTASIRSPTGTQFSVMGKVRSPGTFTPGRYANVLDAISMAGGPAEFANLENVFIIRHQGDRLVTLRAKLNGVFKVGVSASDLDRANIVPLAAGDIVIVP